MFLLKSKGGRLIMRDTGDGVARMVGNDWVLFNGLPSATPPHGDGDVDVREVVSSDGYEYGQPYERPKPAVVAAKESDGAEDAAAAPKKRKPRVR